MVYYIDPTLSNEDIVSNITKDIKPLHSFKDRQYCYNICYLWIYAHSKQQRHNTTNRNRVKIKDFTRKFTYLVFRKINEDQLYEKVLHLPSLRELFLNVRLVDKLKSFENTNNIYMILTF